MGETVSIDSLLGMSGYELIEDGSIPIIRESASLRIFESERNLVAVYNGVDPTKTEERVTAREIFFRASKEKGTLDQFLDDLRIIVPTVIESRYYFNEVGENVSAWPSTIKGFGIIAGASALGFAAGYLAVGAIAGSVLGTIFGVRSHVTKTKEWLSRNRPEINQSLDDLSDAAGEYDFGNSALDELKKEALASFVQYGLIPVETVGLTAEQGDAKDLSLGDTLTIEAKPLAPMLDPFSRYEESGEIGGRVEGGFSGGVDFLSGILGGATGGNIRTSMNGSYSGVGQSLPIGPNTPFRWLMEDTGGNRFIVTGYEVNDAVRGRLKEMGREDMYQEGFYLAQLENEVRKLEGGNADLFYAGVFSSSQVDLRDRPTMRIAGHVLRNDDLPELQLLAFEDRGEEVSVQPYPLSLWGAASSDVLTSLGYDKSPLALVAPETATKD